MNNKNSILKVCRYLFLVTSLIPAMTGLAAAVYLKTPVSWPLVPVVLIGILSLHAFINVTNEYYDFKKGIDINKKQDSVHALPTGEITEEQARKLGIIFAVFAAFCGLFVSFFSGPLVLLIGAAGFTGGYCYTAPPVAYKYKGLGEPAIFIFMGPLLSAGAYAAATGSLAPDAFLLGIPAGLFITAVLHSNNFRDRLADGRTNAVTLSQIIGENSSKLFYQLIIMGTYICIFMFILTKKAPLLSASVIITLPLALKNMAIIRKSRDVSDLDVRTVKLYTFFAVLMISPFFFSGS